MIKTKPEILHFPKIEDQRGNLTFVEGLGHIPFEIKRVYWIYDVPGGQVRGGHAFKMQKELIIALSGSFDVMIDNGKENEIFSLNRSYYGLYVPNGLWRKMQNFSTNSLALVISSTFFTKEDYIWDYAEYKSFTSI